MSKPAYHNIEDRELLDLFYQNRDNDALGELLSRYSLLLMGLCMKYLKNEDLARDAVQQVFLKVITELPKTPVSFFKSWIYMIAKNHCLMQFRNKQYTTPVEEWHQNTIQEEPGIDFLLQKEMNLNHLEKAINQLNNEQQVCITLFYLQKKSYEDIHKETGYSMMQVKSYIQNGKRNLKILIEQSQQSS